MKGRAFVALFLFAAFGFFAVAMLFNFYPPAGNSWLTLLGVAIYVAVAALVVRKVARK
jgi:hypothetical protein